MMFIGGVVKAKYSRMKRLVCKNIYSSLETFGSKLHVISCGKLDRSGVVLISKLEEQQKSLFGGLADTLAFIFPIKFVFNFIFSALYFTYITIPLLVLTYLWSVGIVVFCRRSEHARQFALHISAIYAIVIQFLKKVKRTKFSRLLEVIYLTLSEIIKSIMEPAALGDGVLSASELSELLSYEELSYDEDSADSVKKPKHMHHFVPHNPFRATLRVRRSSEGARTGSLVRPTTSAANSTEFFSDFIAKCTSSLHGANVLQEGSSTPTDDFENDFVMDSPTSFPPTPFSRACWMHKSAERVDSVMFAARDWLRLQSQTSSCDDHSRRVALEAQSLRQFAVFDSRHCSEGIALSCGAHCALKVGNDRCCSVRSMIPISPETFVYMEFSVTAAGGQVPSLSVGLSSLQSSLQSEVGFSPGSVGYSSNGLLSAGSTSSVFAGLTYGVSACHLNAGSTVGFLIYLRPGVERQYRPFSGSPTFEEADRQAGDSDPFVSLVLNVNGIIIPFSSAAHASISKEILNVAPAPVYPTVSLLSPETRIWCRFSEADMFQRSREVIGAPAGCRVYCLDGTLLLGEEDV